MKSYAGIGSRDITPQEVLDIYKIANLLKGYTLYSGNADGADISFQKGSEGNCVLFLPWNNFNKASYWEPALDRISYKSEEAFDSVAIYHPSPANLTQGVRKIMARNYHQVMGIDDYPPVSFVICCANYDENGVWGGTGQACRIAKDKGIPVYNLRELGLEKIMEIINGNCSNFR